jgi:hypothetical protein
MSSPIYVPPNAASFSIVPTQYAALKAALPGDKRVSNLSLNSLGGYATVENVDFGWSYDGVDLVVTILKKHGFFASHYPNAAIFDALQKQLFNGAPYTTGQA